MTRVVLDTNVVVSALINDDGLEAAVVDLAVEGTLSWYVSQSLFAEYYEVLHRPKFSFEPRQLERTLTRMSSAFRLAVPARHLSVCTHDSDNRLLECADAAAAHFLVTGNKRHFPERWESTLVVNARELLDFLSGT